MKNSKILPKGDKMVIKAINDMRRGYSNVGEYLLCKLINRVNIQLKGH